MNLERKKERKTGSKAAESKDVRTLNRKDKKVKVEDKKEVVKQG